MLSIKALDRDIWTIESSHSVLGIDLGGRMTVLRLDSGDLILHSPVNFDKTLKEELDKIGEVKYIVAPNRFHHLHVSRCLDHFPNAKVLGVPGLSKKRKDIVFSSDLRAQSPAQWSGEIETVFVEGIPFLNEIVLYHVKSKTVIFTDLIFNYEDLNSIGIKIFTWLDGIYGKPNISRAIKWFMIKDKDSLRQSFEKILLWDFNRVSLTHKDLIETNGKEIVSKAFRKI